jgi:Fic family protein
MAKLTIVEQYNAIIAKCDGVLTNAELDFLRERADLHAKKNASRKPTKAQNENEAIKVQILELMEPNRAYTVTEIQKAVGLESNQKASALLRQLKECDAVVRSEAKGRAYFTKA